MLVFLVKSGLNVAACCYDCEYHQLPPELAMQIHCCKEPGCKWQRVMSHTAFLDNIQPALPLIDQQVMNTET